MTENGSRSQSHTGCESERDEHSVTVRLFSIAGDEICTLQVPVNVTLAGLKDELSRVSQQLVTQSDRLCCGEETWWDAGSKPLQRMKVSLPGVSESGLEITWVKKELDAGDQCFYIGPSLASNSVVERGDACQIAAAGGCGHLKYRSVFFPRANITLMVHEQHLSRSPPGLKSLPSGCQVGDIFFYTGPPRKGCNGTMLLPGTRGEIVEAGLIEGSVRLHFQNFPGLCSVEFQNLATDPPKFPCSALLRRFLQRFVVKLCGALSR